MYWVIRASVSVRLSHPLKRRATLVLRTLLQKMMSIDSNETDHWLQLAKDFDAQFQKLSSLLSSSNGIAAGESDDEADKAVAGQVLGSMGETCQMLNVQLDSIVEGQAGLPSAQQLLQGLKRMIGLERASPSPMSTPTNCPPGKKQAVTPTRYYLFLNFCPSYL